MFQPNHAAVMDIEVGMLKDGKVNREGNQGGAQTRVRRAWISFCNSLATGLVVGSLYALCAIGWGLIYGTTLHFHVAHGAVFALAAYYAYVGSGALHLPLAVAILLAILAPPPSGLLIDLLLYQQLERRGAYRTSLFIASLGLLILVENVLAIVFTPDPMRMDIGVLNTAVILGPVYLTYCTSSPSRSPSWDTSRSCCS